MRAAADRYRIDEADFRRAGLRVLLEVPSHHVLLDEKTGGASQKDGPRIHSVLFHVSPFPRVRRRAPGSGETSDGIRLRTSSKSAFRGSGNIISETGGLFKNHACAPLAFFFSRVRFYFCGTFILSVVIFLKSWPFLPLLVPFHEEEPFPEGFDIMVAIGKNNKSTIQVLRVLCRTLFVA